MFRVSSTQSSISIFRDNIFQFRHVQDDRQKFFLRDLYPGSLAPKMPKMCSQSLSLMFFLMIDIFDICQNSRWQPKFRKLKNFQRHYIQSL